MRLIGELNRSFDNFLTLRGVAKMGDLDEISKSDGAYQRDLYAKHGKAMEAFLKAGEYTFYPELILSATLDTTGKNSGKVDSLYANIPQGNFRKTTFGDFRLAAKTRKIKSQVEERIYDYHCTGTLDIIDPQKEILNRIDGNHRLSATRKAGTEDELVPFCIIFFRNQQEAKKAERMLFTNINYKHLPLTHEDNYRLIFERDGAQNYFYTDEQLKNSIWFGEHFISARKALEKLDLSNLPNIQKVLLKKNGDHKYTRTVLVDLFKLLIVEEMDERGELQDALRTVEQCYRKYPQNTGKNYQLLVAHLYFYYKGDLNIFSNWIFKNHIYELESIDVDGLIEIWGKILKSKKRTIFLAMDFRDNAKQNREAIEAAVTEINQQTQNHELELQILRMDELNEGNSFTITDEILKQIEGGGYLIADLSLGNKNVYHEIGYQMGLNQGKGLEQDNFLLIHNEGVKSANFTEDIGFNISTIKIVTASDSYDLKEKVKKQIAIHYGFRI